LICALALLSVESACADVERSPESARSAEDRRRAPGFAFDLVRLGFPSGVGMGFRYLPIPELALEAGLSSVAIATGLDVSLVALPVPGGVNRRANLLVRTGYRTASLHALADRVMVRVIPGIPRGGQLSISGAHLGFIFTQIGATYRFRAPLLLEMSLGYMVQIGRATSRVGGRAAISQTGARLPLGELRLSYLLDRRRSVDRWSKP